MFGLGAGELFLVFLIALFFLGPKKLPELAKGLGKAVSEFNKAKDEMIKEIHKPETKTINNENKLASSDKENSEIMEKRPENKLS